MTFRLGLVVTHKRIRVLLVVQVAQRVVDTPVDGLVGTDVEDQVPHGASPLGHVPVLHGQFGDLEARVAPLGQEALFDLLDAPGVGVHGLLLEVADEAVADLGRDEVRAEEGVEEDALRGEDHRLHEPARLAHLHERQEVHAFVVRLFQQRLDPPVVPLHAAEGAEVAEHTGDHAGDARDGLQKHKPHELWRTRFVSIPISLRVPDLKWS